MSEMKQAKRDDTRGRNGRIGNTVKTTFDPALINTLVRESRAAQGLPPTIIDADFHRRALVIVDRANAATARQAASDSKAA